MDSLIEIARRPFVEMAPDLAGALVLLDAGAAEAAQLSLGPAFLFGLGAANVCELERCHPDDALFGQLLAATAAPAPPGAGGAATAAPQLHVVVILTRLLTDSHPLVMRALMVHHQASRVTICCSLSELAHAQQAGTELGVEAYTEYAEALRQDLAQARAAAGLPVPREDQLRLSVRHLPLHVAALDGATFVLPAAGAPAGMATAAGGRAAGFGPADRACDDADEGAMGVSGGLSLLAHALVDVARQIGARAEPFALGPVSAAIAREISTLPQPAPAGGALFGAPPAAAAPALGSPRFGGGGSGGGGGPGGGGGATAHSMALILIDRSLDLVAPCGHSDHFLDAAAELLQRRPPAPAPPRPPGAGRWAMHRPADIRIEAPGIAPWDCLGPSSAGAPAAPAPPAAAAAAAAHAGAGEQQQEQRRGDGSGPEQQQQKDSGGDSGGELPALSNAPPLGAPLFEPSDRRAVSLLEAAAARKPRDALMGVRKALKDALRAERVTPSVRAKLGGVAAAELEGLASSLAQAPGDAALRQLPALFLGTAAAQVLGGPRWGAWCAMAPLERQLVALVDDACNGGGAASGAGAALVALFTDVLESVKAGRGALTAADVLQLLVTLYCLSGDLNPPAPPMYSADEHAIRRALAAALAAAAAAMSGGGAGADAGAVAAASACWEALPAPLQAAIAEASPDNSGSGGLDVSALEAALDARLAEAFGRLRWVAAARGKLRDVRRLAGGMTAEGAPEAAPLVRQVLSRILMQEDIRDLQSQDGPSIGGILKAGLGRFGLGAAIGAIGAAAGAAAAGGGGRPRPHEFPAVMVFVVGGISAAEWRGARAELERHAGGRRPAVLLGGTALLSPADAVRQLLA